MNQDPNKLHHTLQHSATHCDTLQQTSDTLQHNTTHCSTIQRNATHYSTMQHTATHCKTLQHTATDMRHTATQFTMSDLTVALSSQDNAAVLPAIHCNTLQHTATHCNTLQHTATYINLSTQHSSAACNTLQHTDPNCSTLQNTTVLSTIYCYGVATVSKIDKMIGLFCRILALL